MAHKTIDWTRPRFRAALKCCHAVGAGRRGRRAVLQASDLELSKGPATADAVIVLWMGGGMASTEVFDPKRHTPFTAGMKAADVCSTFPSIDTAVDGIKFSRTWTASVR